MHSHLFFDLDHTLWDFERNANETLTELFNSFQLEKYSDTPLPFFLNTFQETNHALWHLFNQGIVSQAHLRETRFKMVFEKCGMAFKQTELFAEIYLETCPRKSHLIPGAEDVLAYLSEKKYPMHIITNGFPDTQFVKLQAGGILHYFENVITSDSSGFRKPDKKIFEFALAKARTHAHTSFMIGDTLETDVTGASQAGMKTVFFNIRNETHKAAPDFEIRELAELKKIF